MAVNQAVRLQIRAVSGLKNDFIFDQVLLSLHPEAGRPVAKFTPDEQDVLYAEAAELVRLVPNDAHLAWLLEASKNNRNNMDALKVLADSAKRAYASYIFGQTLTTLSYLEGHIETLKALGVIEDADLTKSGQLDPERVTKIVDLYPIPLFTTQK